MLDMSVGERAYWRGCRLYRFLHDPGPAGLTWSHRFHSWRGHEFHVRGTHLDYVGRRQAVDSQSRQPDSATSSIESLATSSRLWITSAAAGGVGQNRSRPVGEATLTVPAAATAGGERVSGGRLDPCAVVQGALGDLSVAGRRWARPLSSKAEAADHVTAGGMASGQIAPATRAART
jgi:hypothetical protein